MPIPASIAARRRERIRAPARARGAAAAGLGRVLRWHELARRRRALLTLNERMLKDLGISRAEAERQESRPFWQDGTQPWRWAPA
jgi:uncharacterized protein YjiS (DUF1127 family)